MQLILRLAGCLGLERQALALVECRRTSREPTESLATEAPDPGPLRRETVEDSFGGRSDRPHRNSVDVLRMLGALCIMWYHSACFWSLQPPLQQTVQHVKLATISRRLPFFYTISSWLARLSTSRDASARTIYSCDLLEYTNV